MAGSNTTRPRPRSNRPAADRLPRVLRHGHGDRRVRSHQGRPGRRRPRCSSSSRRNASSAGWTWPRRSSPGRASGATRPVATTTCTEVMAVMDRSDTRQFIGCEGRAVQLDDRHIMVSMPYVNPTPWNTPREAPEPELAERIEAVAGDLPGYDDAIFNFHAPPKDSTLDTCPQLDWTTDPPSQLVTGGQPVLYGAGSEAVRAAIERVPAAARPAWPHPRVPGRRETRSHALRQPGQRVRGGCPPRARSSRSPTGGSRTTR